MTTQSSLYIIASLAKLVSQKLSLRRCVLFSHKFLQDLSQKAEECKDFKTASFAVCNFSGPSSSAEISRNLKVTHNIHGGSVSFKDSTGVS